MRTLKESSWLLLLFWLLVCGSYLVLPTSSFWVSSVRAQEKAAGGDAEWLMAKYRRFNVVVDRLFALAEEGQHSDAMAIIEEMVEVAELEFGQNSLMVP